MWSFGISIACYVVVRLLGWVFLHLVGIGFRNYQDEQYCLTMISLIVSAVIVVVTRMRQLPISLWWYALHVGVVVIACNVCWIGLARLYYETIDGKVGLMLSEMFDDDQRAWQTFAWIHVEGLLVYAIPTAIVTALWDRWLIHWKTRVVGQLDAFPTQTKRQHKDES